MIIDKFGLNYESNNDAKLTNNHILVQTFIT